MRCCSWSAAAVPSVVEGASTVALRNYPLRAQELVLWKRPAVVALRDFVGGVDRGGHIYGPRGCGKSAATFAAVLALADRHQKSLLWVHYLFDVGGAFAARVTWEDDDQDDQGDAPGAPQGRKAKRAETATLGGKLDSLEAALAERDYDIVVVDGCVKGKHDEHAAAAYLYTRRGAVVVVVSSTALDLDVEGMLQLNLEVHTFEAFSKDDILAAALAPAVWRGCADAFKEEFDDLHWAGELEADSVHRATANDKYKLVRRKAKIAGVVARWIFDFTSSDVRKIQQQRRKRQQQQAMK